MIPSLAVRIQHRSDHESAEFDRRVGPARSRNELDGTADTLFSGIRIRLQPQCLFQQHAPEIHAALPSLQSLLCFPALNQPHPAIAERLWLRYRPAFCGGSEKRIENNERNSAGCRSTRRWRRPRTHTGTWLPPERMSASRNSRWQLPSVCMQTTNHGKKSALLPGWMS